MNACTCCMCCWWYGLHDKYTVRTTLCCPQFVFKMIVNGVWRHVKWTVRGLEGRHSGYWNNIQKTIWPFLMLRSLKLVIYRMCRCFRSLNVDSLQLLGLLIYTSFVFYFVWFVRFTKCIALPRDYVFNESYGNRFTSINCVVVLFVNRFVLFFCFVRSMSRWKSTLVQKKQ